MQILLFIRLINLNKDLQIACLLVNVSNKHINLENNRTTDIINQITCAKDNINT